MLVATDERYNGTRHEVVARIYSPVCGIFVCVLTELTMIIIQMCVCVCVCVCVCTCVFERKSVCSYQRVS